jgi:hypothetical protein
MLRQRVLRLYKQILRTGHTWEAKDPKDTQKEREYIKEEARKRFKANKGVNTSLVV